MKKITLAIAMIAGVCGANAQTSYEGSKFTDNWSIGLQGGVYEPTMGQSIFKDMRPAINLELQKQITPVFGVGLNYMVGINANNANSRSFTFKNDYFPAKTAIDFSNLSVNGLINLMNAFGGYKGQPRTFETIVRVGAGWGYIMGDRKEDGRLGRNFETFTAGLDLNFNLGKAKAWQINVKPSITYYDWGKGFDVRQSYLQLLAGVTYKFKNSNGTHNFVINNKKYTQEQIDELNARINAYNAEKESLNRTIGQNNKTIATLKEELAAERSKEKTIITNTTNTTTTQLAPVVIFGQGKKVIDASQRPSVAMIATYMKNHPESKVRIQGYASPEGNADFNQKLSEARAQAVYDMLVKTYGISKDRLSCKGMGVTDELFDENDWNRVATFIETNPASSTTTTTVKK